MRAQGWGEMGDKSLIEKLEALKNPGINVTFGEWGKARNAGIDDAIEIIRQHEAEQSANLVAEVRTKLHAEREALKIHRIVWDVADVIEVVKPYLRQPFVMTEEERQRLVEDMAVAIMKCQGIDPNDGTFNSPAEAIEDYSDEAEAALAALLERFELRKKE